MRSAILLGFVFVLAISLSGVLSGCATTPDERHYGRGDRNSDSVIATFGQPMSIIPQEDGTEIWIFHGQPGVYRNRYFVIQGDRVIGGGMNYVAPW